MIIKKQKTKTLITKSNNNSSDFIAPNLLYGCFGNCQYCYMHRYNHGKLYINENVDDIFKSCVTAVEKLNWPKVANQQDPVWNMIDIACNSDLVLHQKHLPEPLEDYLKRFDEHPMMNTTMATKYPSLLKLDVRKFNKKPRVRVSLMPQKYSSILEPKMQSISSRIKDIKRLHSLGWEVHINFSPVICYKDWLEEYGNLFKEIVDSGVDLSEVKSEVIFLTNHKNTMERVDDKVKDVIKYSSEVKNKSGVMRYPLKYKHRLVEEFTDLHDKYLSIPIRYIF